MSASAEWGDVVGGQVLGRAAVGAASLHIPRERADRTTRPSCVLREAINARLRTASYPLLAALIHLLLPERHASLARVDRVLARGERVLAMWGGHRDHDAGLTDVDAPGAMVDRNRAKLVPADQLRRDLRHHLLRHLLVGLVVETDNRAAARLRACCADERRDRAGLI